MQTIEEAVSKAIDGLEAAEVEQPEVDAVVEVPEEPAEAPAEGPVEEVPEEPEAPAEPEPVETPEEPEPASDPDDRAPNSWKTGAVAEKWKDLPAEIKSEIHRRETDFHKGLEQYREDANFGRQFGAAISPYARNFQASGIHPAQAINHLLMLEDKLRNGDSMVKAQVVLKIANDYGVDLQQAATVTPADQRMFALEQQLQQERAARAEYQQTVQTHQESAVQSEIEKFASDPKNEFFQAVKDDMAQLLQTGIVQNLHDAYEKAVWARPDIRKTLVDRQRTEAERQAAQKTRQKRAQTAASGVKGTAASQVSKLGKNASIEDTIAAAMDGLI